MYSNPTSRCYLRVRMMGFGFVLSLALLADSVTILFPRRVTPIPVTGLPNTVTGSICFFVCLQFKLRPIGSLCLVKAQLDILMESLLWHEMLLFICKPLCVCNLTEFQIPQLMRLAAASIPWAQSFDTVSVQFVIAMLTSFPVLRK